MPSLQPSLQQKWIDVVAKKGLEEKEKTSIRCIYPNGYSVMQHNSKESGNAGCNQGFHSKPEVMRPLHVDYIAASL